ncbi:polysaccharide lyase family 7 protein [Streptomyces sp. NPDC006476]|uniref:polysaccharide lyase family 7 protein n=1 Tax=Streptomyces sp. NPDC006476 TaxID=3157175 RepID=UPI0033B37EE8
MRAGHIRTAVPLLATTALISWAAGTGTATAQQTSAAAAGPTSGLTEYSDAYSVQRPYDLPQSDRFSMTSGPTYNARILKGDKPFKKDSDTGPRTEMRWHATWSGTEHQWSADVKIDSSTEGACIMQVKGSTGGEAIYVNVHGNGNLYNSVNNTPIATGMWGKWFHMNADFDPATGTVRLWIDSKLVLTTHYSAPTSKIWYFKNGVYNTTGPEAEAHFKNITFWEK